MEKSESYKTSKGVLPPQLAEKIEPTIIGVDLTKPILEPFVQDTSSLETTILIDNMPHYYSNSTINWHVPPQWGEGYIPDACYDAFDNERSMSREEVGRAYEIEINTRDLIAIDLNNMTPGERYWVLVHEFLHGFFSRIPDREKALLIKAFYGRRSDTLSSDELDTLHSLDESLSVFFTFQDRYHSSRYRLECFDRKPDLKKALIGLGYKIQEAPRLGDLTTPELKRIKGILEGFYGRSGNEEEAYSEIIKILAQRK